eukprot:s36_g55.t1
MPRGTKPHNIPPGSEKHGDMVDVSFLLEFEDVSGTRIPSRDDPCRTLFIRKCGGQRDLPHIFQPPGQEKSDGRELVER